MEYVWQMSVVPPSSKCLTIFCLMLLAEREDSSRYFLCTVYWGCRIHRLHLRRGVRPPPPTSVQDMILNNLMVRFQWWWCFRECGTPHFIAIALRSTRRRVVAPDSPVYGLNRTKLILMLNWIVWIRTVGLNWIVWKKCFWQLSCVLKFVLNWIVWNEIVFDTKTVLKLNWIV